MDGSRRTGRERKLLLAVVAVSSGVTLGCSSSGPPRYPDGIGLFDSGWNELFDAAARDAGHDAGAPSNDANDTTDSSAH